MSKKRGADFFSFLRAPWRGEKRVNDLKSSDLPDNLLSEAQSIAAERAEILEAIQREEIELSGLQEKLATARGVVSAEEFEAAQTPGGLAIASKTAQQAVADGGLRVKSVGFRLRGLRDKLAGTEKELLHTWQKLERYRDDFLHQRIAEMQRQFDAEVEAALRLLFKARVLRKYCGANHGKAYNFHFSWGAESCFHNPLAQSGNLIRADLFRLGGKVGSIDNHWADDPAAAQLNSEIEALLGAMEPIGSIVKEIGGQRAES
jgi:hypothetical protein